jgi:hypothetical protein
MTNTAMQVFWQSHYPLCPPINYLFKIFYNDRWLRVHSLPDSKRYAETEEEWDILLSTQNKILDDIFKLGNEMILFSGSYNHLDFLNENDSLSNHNSLKNYDFTALDNIDLYARSQDYCEENTYYTPYFTTLFFKQNSYNAILKSVADDELRVFFLNPNTKTIFAPYDGGVDIIYADSATRDICKLNYSHYTQQDKYK